MYESQSNTGKPRVHRAIQRSILLTTSLLMLLVLGVNLSGCLHVAPRDTGEPIATLAAPGDETPPEIQGVKDLTVTLGDALSYREGVTVTDDEDGSPSLEIDTTQVDLTKEGTYPITYTAKDASGNAATVKATVTVLPKPEETQDAIVQAAQAVLDQIITPDMTTRQQVQAIYLWARETITYGGHSDRDDWRQTAYGILENPRGDCFGYFAATKLLFEELGIPNQDVEKVKRSKDDSEHYWSLVSIDGGETWYHFDATPRVGQTEELCLVTDTFLDSFDTYHDNCHNRDKSQYPATPEGWV